MEISTPRRRRILTKENNGKQYKEQIWQIYTTDDKSLVWSILMSYLFSTSKQVTVDNLHEFLDILQYGDVQERSCFHAKFLEFLLKFNPFINREDFYSIPTMKVILNSLKQRLESFIVIDVDQKFYVEKILQSASTLLRCRIDVYNVDDDDTKGKQHYSCLALNMSFGSEYTRRLILFKSSKTFSFGILPQSACFLRKYALRHIAEIFQIPKEVTLKFMKAVSFENDFLTRLICLGYSKDIHFLFRSPLAIEKLSEACLNVDPRKTDKRGFSAFYYCMACADTSALSLLYNYATRNIFTDEDNLRKPNSKSLEIVKEIAYVIKKDCLKSNDFSTLGRCKEFALKLYRQLLRFNEYQISLVGEIVEISKAQTDTFMKQLYITISTLDYYDEYFYIGNNAERNVLGNYVEFAQYYDNLDYFNNTLFFDNIITVSAIADENNKSLFTNAVNSSFLLILARKMFPRKSKQFSNNAELQNMDNNYLQFIPLTYRIEYRSLARDLSKELKMLIKQSRKPNTETFDVIRESLWELPEIKNELIATRFKSFLSILVKTTHETLNSKKSLAVERIMQVVGELICSHDESDCISHVFLCSWFPKEMESAFALIRNHCFSHYRASSVQGRMNLEFNEFETVDQIQKEIFNVHHVFEPITECFKLGMKDFMIKKGMQCSQERHEAIFKLLIEENFENITKKIKHYEKFERYYFTLSRNLLRYISQSLELQKTRRHSGQNKKSNPLVNIKDIKNQFDALIYLSNYISECLQGKSDYSTNLKSNIDKLEVFIRNNSEKNTHEIKEELQCILKEFSIIYNNIWKNNKIRLSKKYMETTFHSLKKYIIFFHKNHFFRQKTENFVKNEIIYSISLKETLLTFFSEIFENESSHKGSFKHFMLKLEKLANWVANSLTIRETNILVHLLQSVFETLRNVLNALEKNPYEINFNSDLLNKYFNDIKDHDIFSQEEIYEIKSTIYQHLIISNENKINLENHLEKVVDKKTNLEDLKIEETLENIVMTKSKQNSIISYIKDSKFHKALTFLKNLKSIKPTQFKYAENVSLLLQQILNDEKYRIMFLRITFPPNLQTKINQKFHFLISRIKLMKKLLIDDDVHIKREWVRTKTHCEERHMKIMMCKKYITEGETRAALEMLIFDCLNILEDTDLEELWEKKCNLFTGINLRDFLSHGGPIIEGVVNCLDSNEFPLEFINKILEFINDIDAMTALLELWEKLESRKFSDLMDIINMDCDDDYNYLRIRIKSSNRTESDGRLPRWEKYLKVLNLDIDSSTWSQL